MFRAGPLDAAGLFMKPAGFIEVNIRSLHCPGLLNFSSKMEICHTSHIMYMQSQQITTGENIEKLATMEPHAVRLSKTIA